MEYSIQCKNCGGIIAISEVFVPTPPISEFMQPANKLIFKVEPHTCTGTIPPALEACECRPPHGLLLSIGTSEFLTVVCLKCRKPIKAAVDPADWKLMQGEQL